MPILLKGSVVNIPNDGSPQTMALKTTHAAQTAASRSPNPLLTLQLSRTNQGHGDFTSPSAPPHYIHTHTTTYSRMVPKDWGATAGFQQTSRSSEAFDTNAQSDDEINGNGKSSQQRAGDNMNDRH